MTTVPAVSGTPPAQPAMPKRQPEPLTLGARPAGNEVMVKVFVVVPFLALLGAVPFAWGWGLTVVDIALAAVFYLLTLDRRHRRVPPLLHPPRVQGQPGAADRAGGRWAAWRCRARSSAGSPTTAATTPSPTRRATRTRPGCSAPRRPRWPAASGTPTSGWMFRRDQTNPARFAPDLLADPDIARGQPAVPALDGAQPGRARRARRAAQLVLVGRADRVLLGRAGPHRRPAPRHLVGQLDLPHGRRPALDRRGTAPPTSGRWPSCRMGESWHNLHHADPTCARHGVGRGQIDISARLIWIFETFGWAHDVRWPTPQRLARLAASRDRRS